MPCHIVMYVRYFPIKFEKTKRGVGGTLNAGAVEWKLEGTRFPQTLVSGSKWLSTSHYCSDPVPAETLMYYPYESD